MFVLLKTENFLQVEISPCISKGRENHYFNYISNILNSSGASLGIVKSFGIYIQGIADDARSDVELDSDLRLYSVPFTMVWRNVL